MLMRTGVGLKLRSRTRLFVSGRRLVRIKVVKADLEIPTLSREPRTVGLELSVGPDYPFASFRAGTAWIGSLVTSVEGTREPVAHAPTSKEPLAA